MSAQAWKCSIDRNVAKGINHSAKGLQVIVAKAQKQLLE